MEILDYLCAARRRLALIIAVPLLAMALAAGLVMLQPTTYSAAATVDGPVFVGETSRFAGAQGSNLYVSTFQSTATGPGLLSEVSRATGESIKALGDGLLVARVGASTSLQVSYTARSRDRVEPVLREVTSLTLRRIFDPQVDASLARVEAAQAAVAAANEAIAEFGTRTGVADPQRSYEAQLNQVNALVQQEANLRANGNSIGAAALGGTIDTARAQLATYTPLLAEYGNLVIDLQAAAAGVDDAQASLEQSRAQVTSADPDTIVFVSSTIQDAKSGTLVRTVIPVGAAALFLAVLLAAALETLARARGAAPLARPAPHRGAGDAPRRRVLGLWPSRRVRSSEPPAADAGTARSAAGRSGPAPTRGPLSSEAAAPGTAAAEARNGADPTRPPQRDRTGPAAAATHPLFPRPEEGSSRPAGTAPGDPTRWAAPASRGES